MTQDQRRGRLKAIAQAYFDGLHRHDVSAVPWHPDVELYAPLAPDGLARPVRGRDAVAGFITALFPLLGEVRVLEHYLADDLTGIATRADVSITSPPCTLRVVDRFTVDLDGLITAQENHYDPRPALAG